MLATARAFVALLIAVSLTFAPFAAAKAKRAPGTGAGLAASHAVDCHKAAHHHATPAGHKCCDHGSKSTCPDQGCGCAFGCGAQTLAVFYLPEPVLLTSADEFELPNSARPPGLCQNPLGPPPRA